jgi:hypothetical protein
MGNSNKLFVIMDNSPKRSIILLEGLCKRGCKACSNINTNSCTVAYPGYTI